MLSILPLLFCTASAVTVTSYAPIPATAAGPVVPTPPVYRVDALGRGAYLVTDGLYDCMFLVGSESVIAVDAPPTIGENLVRAIRSITTKPVSHVVYSHHHADHIGAAYLLGAWSNVTFVGHRLTADELALVPDPHRPPPAITFDSSYILRVGNQTLELDYRGINHDPGNIFIYAPVQKVLMLVDIVYPGWTPFNLLGEAQSVPGFIKAHNQLLDYSFECFIGGHLGRAGTRQDVSTARDYVLDLLTTSMLAINMSAESNNSLSVASVIGPEVTQIDPNNPWALFNTYIDVLVEYVANDLLTRWGSRLEGLDVYGPSHAEAMLEAVRIDYGILGPFGVAA